MMGVFRDVTGQRFGLLTVLKRANENTKNNTSRWVCRCDCGNITTVAVTKLTRGSTLSCGCYKKSKKGKSNTRVCKIWRAMISRCENPKHDHYNRYGGRGIKVCEEWHSFEVFEKWALENGYDDTLSIDRVDNNGDYSPSNCRWATQKQQMNNIQNNRRYTVDGKSFTRHELADYLGVPCYFIDNHERIGKTTEEIICLAQRKHG